MQIPEQLIDVDKDVRIELYTLKNLNEPQLLNVNDKSSIERSNYNSKNPTRIFVHGFQADGSLTKIFIDGIVYILFLNFLKVYSKIVFYSVFHQGNARCESNSDKLAKSFEYNRLSECKK